MQKAHPEDELREIIVAIRKKMEAEGLAFIAPAADHEDFKSQVKGALRFLENS